MANEDLKKVSTGVTRLAAWLWILISGCISLFAGLLMSYGANANEFVTLLILVVTFGVLTAPGWLVLRLLKKLTGKNKETKMKAI